MSATICIAGLWHQGSVLSGGFADIGHQVRGVGGDARVVAALQAGEPPVYEPKLGAILRRNVKICGDKVVEVCLLLFGRSCNRRGQLVPETPGQGILRASVVAHSQGVGV